MSISFSFVFYHLKSVPAPKAPRKNSRSDDHFRWPFLFILIEGKSTIPKKERNHHYEKTNQNNDGRPKLRPRTGQHARGNTGVRHFRHCTGRRRGASLRPDRRLTALMSSTSMGSTSSTVLRYPKPSFMAGLQWRWNGCCPVRHREYQRNHSSRQRDYSHLHGRRKLHRNLYRETVRSMTLTSGLTGSSSS